jgi:hypothetical protein
MEQENNIQVDLEIGRDCEQHTVSSEQDIVAGSCERGNEASGSTKDGEFVNQQSQYHAIKGPSLNW